MLIIHGGMFKAGSTFLQRQVFPNAAEAHYLGGFDSVRDKYHPSIADLDEIIRNPIQRAQDLDELSNRLNRFHGDSKIWILSNEAFFGDIFAANITDLFLFRDKILPKLDPGIKMIFVTRDSVSLRKSIYSQFVLQGGWLNREEYFSGVNGRMLNEYMSANTECFFEGNFDTLLINFSELIKDKELVFKKISQFAKCGNITVARPKIYNQKLSDPYIEAIRRINTLMLPKFLGKFIQRVFLNIHRLGGGNRVQ